VKRRLASGSFAMGDKELIRPKKGKSSHQFSRIFKLFLFREKK